MRKPKTREVEVFYPMNCYPFETSGLALVEYHETEEGPEIEAIYLPEYVKREDREDVKKQVKQIIYN